jgi:AAA domain
LSEEIAVAPVVAGSEEIDVPKLWRALIEVETEMTTEGVAQLDSVFDRQADAHRVSIELERGEFDYKRDDTVAVERQDRKGIWRKIGELQLRSQRLDSDKVMIAANSIIKGRLIEAGQRLRFTSHFEFQSLRRRRDAVNRVLAGDGRAGELLSVFDPRSGATPSRVEHAIDEAALQFYDLNQDQKNAFEQIVNARPIGLLQGPPGTGKTRFIAALTHYAITKGLARNVLLASQANEAVNTAAEAVLSLFAKSGGIPSMLRVGSNERISSALEPYHATKVEQAYRDRFAGSFAERIALAGRAIGLPSEVVADIAALETTVRPVVSRINDLAGKAETDKQRMDGLIETLRQHLASLNMEDFLAASADQDYWSSFIDAAADKVVERHRGSPAVSSDKVERLRRVCAIGRDFTGTVSRAQRSFETFLAGTRQIVVGTCVGLGRTSLELTTSAFDLVIVDEAARCTASELLVPLQAARWAVLVGDQAQLQPTHEPEVINQVAARTLIPKREIRRSDFERVFETPYGRAASSALTTQYRMLPTIGSLVSETFYPNLKLVPGRSDPEIDPALLPLGLGKTLTWVETDGLGAAAFEREEDSSYTNKVEAEGIVLLLEDWLSHERFREWLENYRRHPAGIGVICMYAAQRDFVERKLRQSPAGDLLNRGIKVGTVDSYQGKENPIVIVSLVRNNENGRTEGGIRRIKEGFLSTPNRINVAASRAMDRLVIVGARRRWRSEGPVERINQAFERQIAADAASVVAIDTILDQERGQRDQAQSRRANRKAGGAYERA